MLRQDSHHFWWNADKSLLVKGTSSTCSNAWVCGISASSEEFQSTLWGTNIDGTTIPWLHQKLHARTGTRDPTKPGFSVSGRLSPLWPVPLTSPDDVCLMLIWNWSELSVSLWSLQHLIVSLKEFSLSTKLYSVHPSSVNQRLFGVTEVTGVYPSVERWESNHLIIFQCLIQGFAPRMSLFLQVKQQRKTLIS